LRARPARTTSPEVEDEDEDGSGNESDGSFAVESEDEVGQDRAAATRGKTLRGMPLPRLVCTVHLRTTHLTLLTFESNRDRTSIPEPCHRRRQ